MVQVDCELLKILCEVNGCQRKESKNEEEKPNIIYFFNTGILPNYPDNIIISPSTPGATPGKHMLKLISSLNTSFQYFRFFHD